MGKKSARRLLAIKQMMNPAQPAATKPKRSRPEEESVQTSRAADAVPAVAQAAPATRDAGISGDVLDDNFLVEDIGVDSLDANADTLNESSNEDAADRLPQNQAAANKKRRTEALKEKRKGAKEGKLRREDSLAIVTASAREKAAFFQRHLKASDTGGRMSEVELEDHVSSEHFLGDSIGLDSIGVQLKQLCPACITSAAMGVSASVPAPVVAILVSSSQRGGQVYQRLKEASQGNTIVKAYESHSKIKKLLSQFLKSDAALRTRIVVATAGRLLRLLSGGEMESERLELVVLDLAPDEKMRTLLDMKEVREDVVKLHTTLLAPHLRSHQLKIVLM